MEAILFPGQGSQAKGMGKELFSRFEGEVQLANEILGFDIVALCLHDTNRQLAQTQFTQPAIFFVSALAFLDRMQNGGKNPDFSAGHSLGEYNALLAAKVFDLETGLKLVKKRGEVIAKAKHGGMAAIVGITGEEVENIIKEHSLNSIDIANLNTRFQTVISGPKQDVLAAESAFQGNPNVRLFMPLNVSGAFHSRYMKEAKDEFEEFLTQFSFAPPQFPVISNVTARPHQENEIKTLIAQQITSPVKWEESMRYLMGKGIKDFIEVGHGKVLTGMINKILHESEPFHVKEEPPKTKKRGSQKNSAAPSPSPEITPESLGDQEFKKDYGIKYSYISGSMYRGTASKELVVKMGKAGLMGFLGAAGMDLEWLESDLRFIQEQLDAGEAYGINLLHNQIEPEMEDKTVDLFLKYGITCASASAYMDLTPAIVRYRVKGLSRDDRGNVIPKNRVFGKISRPEVSAVFLAPPPKKILTQLVNKGLITEEEAKLAEEISMADEIVVEADSGGHTDAGNAAVLLPTMIRLRDEAMEKFGYPKKIRVGAAGGIGTPESAASAFILGADFILTGSINHCTVEAGTSDLVKDLLSQANVQDTAYAPAGDMFEIGARVQVLKKGLFFPARANKLYELYKTHNSLDEIDQKTLDQLERNYFKKTIAEIWEETVEYFKKRSPEEIDKAQGNPKHKMALIFRWYFGMSTRAAFEGDESRKVDLQIHVGPALGAFNQWVKGTKLEDWRNRHVDEIAELMMKETAAFLNRRIQAL